MADINNLKCRLVKDPVVRYTNQETGKSIIQLTVAKTIRVPKEKGSKEYVDAPVYINDFEMKNASPNLLKYLKKGTLVLISAEFANSNYEKDGKEIHREYKNVTNIDIISQPQPKEAPAADEEPEF